MDILRRENETLKRLVENSDGTIERLRTLPEHEALALFHRFRAADGDSSNNVRRRPCTPSYFCCLLIAAF